MREHREIVLQLRCAPRPQQQRRNGRVRQGKLQRRRPKRGFVGGADRLNGADAIQDGRRRRIVVEGRAGPGASRKDFPS